jgi:hypothetical protein
VGKKFDACFSEGRTELALEQHVYTLCLCGVARAKGLAALLEQTGREWREKKRKEIKIADTAFSNTAES